MGKNSVRQPWKYCDNLKLALDSTCSYIATSNRDRWVRIWDYYTGKLITKICPGELTTGLCFTENNKHLITVSVKGCIFFWKLPGRMIKNMNKQKKQLGLIYKHVQEMVV